jgi:hypothetical protein
MVGIQEKLPLLSNFALLYATRKVQEYQKKMKLNVTHKLMVYADDDNILGKVQLQIKN